MTTSVGSAYLQRLASRGRAGRPRRRYVGSPGALLWGCGGVTLRARRRYLESSLDRTDSTALRAIRVSSRRGSLVVSLCRPRPGRRNTRAMRWVDASTASQSSIVNPSERRTIAAEAYTVGAKGHTRWRATATGKTRAAKFVPHLEAKRVGRAVPLHVS